MAAGAPDIIILNLLTTPPPVVLVKEDSQTMNDVHPEECNLFKIKDGIKSQLASKPTFIHSSFWE